MQTTNKVFMVRPTNFGYNKQTASNNAFQNNLNISNSNELALNEFNNYVSLLINNGVNVITVKDTDFPHTPDSIFPNNWFSTHLDGTLVLYSMFAENRRQERKEIFINEIKRNTNIKKVIDLSIYENENIFLEGTGSLVLDRDNKIMYACKSPRTNEKLIDILCKELNYKYILFDSVDKNNKPIYHTNVLLSITSDYAVVCLDSIKDRKQKETLVKSFKETKKEIIEISFNQLEHFLGNILELRNNNNEKLLVMSSTAKDSLNSFQYNKLISKYKIISPNIKTIETLGGGSARCMIAELFC